MEDTVVLTYQTLLSMVSSLSSTYYKYDIMLAAKDLGPPYGEQRQPAARSGAPGAARLLLASASSSFFASPGLCPGHGAGRRGWAAVAFPSAAVAADAAAADRGRPVAAGSLCE